MNNKWQRCIDDLPDFILAGFAEVRRTTGQYPRRLVVGQLLAEMMDTVIGVWGPAAPGVWGWLHFLDPKAAVGRDEFGLPE